MNNYGLTETGHRRLTKKRKMVPVQAFIPRELYGKFRQHYRRRGAISSLIRKAFEAAVAAKEPEVDEETNQPQGPEAV